LRAARQPIEGRLRAKRPHSFESHAKDDFHGRLARNPFS
jgi:hypothetical protein